MRLRSWFHPNSTCTCEALAINATGALTGSSLVSANGDKSVPLTAAAIRLQVQRHGCKGVISIRSLKKLAANASLSGQSVKEIMSLVIALYVA
ncbi:hypothetical protein [Paenibacillus aestuarii]|uniref:Uncharacterized protein n=1 Tax=Paenibacillus aestuarii TaxID=516965 RepID=A0ABW0K0R8_9BACL|nr:hypothetical protein [Paenibacillus aestuarii]